MGHYKFDRRFSEVTPRGQYVRRNKKNALKGHRRASQVYKNTVMVGLIGFLVLTWFVCWSNNRISPIVEDNSISAMAHDTVPTIEERDGVGRESRTYESAEIPAGYVEPDLFDKYFKADAKVMRAICRAESGMKEKAVSKPNRNGTIDRGICQVNSIHLWRVGGDASKLLDKETNIRVSYDIFRDNKGFNPWTCFTNGDYLKHLEY